MTWLQALFAPLGTVLLVAVLAGVMVRRRYRDCGSFALYLGAVLVPMVLTVLWPDRFYRLDFWLFKEALHNLLKFAIAIELGLRIFRPFPRAHANARRIVLFVLVVTGASVLIELSRGSDIQGLATRVHPRILTGTVCLFTALGALILWYRLPLDAFQKAIVLGFVPFLLVFSVAQTIVDQYGWHLREYTNYAYSTAYAVLLAYWTRAAWRPVLMMSGTTSRPTTREGTLRAGAP